MTPSGKGPSLDLLSAHIPRDRRRALTHESALPDRTVGAALFADISGFTPLTEAMVRALGARRGAEELTGQLNAVYDALIDTIDRAGGSVIGFSGDAITCWFDGDSGRQAIACALAMQEAMQAFASIPVPAGGTVALALKVAVATGPARRFLVGDPTIQLMDAMAGVTLQHVAAAEHLALKGEVVVDAATARSLADILRVAEWRTDAEAVATVAVVSGLVGRTETALVATWDDDALTDDQVRPWLLPPVYERLHAGQGEFLAELRTTVTLFLRFGGIDYDGDDGAGATLNTFVRHVQHILTRYGGAVLQVIIGDKGSYLYGAFGAPVAHDDDALRAVSAALDLCQPSGSIDGHIAHIAQMLAQVQIGISRGRMRVGAYGGITRRTYGVLGDEANVAARLMAKADPGQILMSDAVAELVRRQVVLEDLGAIRVKGKSDPLMVSRALSRRRSVTQRPGRLFPHALVGRQDELAQMAAVIETALAGSGRILRLEGAAGVGKSRLSAELVARADRMGMDVIVASCQSTTQETAYAPWQQAFRTLLDLDGTGEPETEAQIALLEKALAANPDWGLRLPLLGDLVGLAIADNATTGALEPRLRRNALIDLAVEILLARAHEQPLLVLLDDVHWMDDASQALTVALGRSVERAPMVLALVHRPALPASALLPELDDLSNHHRVTLGELDGRDVGSLVSSRLGGTVTSLALSFVVAQTYGNPFFVEELVETLRESGRLIQRYDGRWDLADEMAATLRQSGCLVWHAGAWTLAPDADLPTAQLGLPDSVEGMVLARIDRLPEADKLTLRVASVIGRVFSLDVLARAHPLQPSAAALEAQLGTLKARDFARVEDAGPRPRYIFKHNITYEVAYDTLLFSQRRQLHRAVGEALQALEPDAVAQLGHHAHQGEDWPRALQYQMEAGRQAERLFAAFEGIEHFNRALHSAEHLAAHETVAQRQDAHTALGELLTATGEYEPALGHLEAGLTLAEQRDDPDAQACACRWFARVYELRGEYAPALDWIARGLRVLEGRPTTDAAEALVTAGLIHTRKGDFAEAQTRAQEGFRVAEEIGARRVSARALGLLGFVCRLQGDTGQALVHTGEALGRYQRADDIYGQALMHTERGNIFMARGPWHEAYEHYQQAREIFDQVGDRYNYALINNNLGAITRQQGRLDDALDFFRQGRNTLEQIGGSPYLMGVFELNLGNTYIRKREAHTAHQHLGASQECFDRAGARQFLPELYYLRAEAHLLTGDVAQAEEDVRSSLDLAREQAAPSEEAVALHVAGQIAALHGDWKAAERCLMQSAALLHEAGEEYYEARSRLALAQTLHRQGDENRAQAELLAALTVFETLGAALDLSAARSLQDDLALVRPA